VESVIKSSVGENKPTMISTMDIVYVQ